MNNIKLIIHRTLNGLDVDYTSEPINESELEANGILYDERNQINQLDCSVVLSVTNTSESKVYSYINNRVLDVSKRRGFYAIRMIIPRNMRIPLVYQILQKIAQRYDQHRESNTINTLNYDDILHEINTNIQPIGTLLSTTIYKSTCYSFISFAELGDSALNNFKLELFQKTYLLDDVDKESESSLKEFGMKDFRAMANQIREIKIDNPDNLLTGIWLNDIRLDYSHIKTSTLKLACLDSDQIHYTSVLNKNKDTLPSYNHLVLQRPQPVYRSGGGYSSSRGSTSSGPYWLALLALVVGVSGGYFGGQYFDFPFFKKTATLPAQVQFTEPTNPFHLTINNDGSNAFVLETDTTIQDTLTNYFFKYDPKVPIWRLKEKSDKRAGKELTRADLHALFDKDSIRVDQVIKALQRYSDISIKDSLPSTTISNSSPKSEKKLGNTAPVAGKPTSSNTSTPNP